MKVDILCAFAGGAISYAAVVENKTKRIGSLIMEKNRLEAFSDGVIAIILTIMVLDLKVPKEPTLEGLSGFWPVYFAYALSYAIVFFVWLNHHSIFSSLKHVDYPLLWANGFLLFFVSLVPFVTAFASETHWTEPLPVALYGLVNVAISIAFTRLRQMASKQMQTAREVAQQLFELRVSLFLAAAFIVGSATAWIAPKFAMLVYAVVPLVRAAIRRT